MVGAGIKIGVVITGVVGAGIGVGVTGNLAITAYFEK